MFKSTDDNMLTPNPNQYLRPDYLSPLPTTLDAKKSPLALLAQTCSNIGMDSPNNKPMLAVDKSKKSSDNNSSSNISKKADVFSSFVGSSSSSSSSVDDNKPAFKPYDLKKSSTSPRSDASTNNDDKRSSPLSQKSPRTSPAVSEKSDKGKSTPSKADTPSSIASIPSTSSSATVTSASTTLTGLGYPGLVDLSRDPTKDSLAALSLAYKGLNHLGASPLAGHMPPLDFKGLPYPGLSPYAGYARVKTPSGGTSLVPVCRDPFCTSCQLSMQTAQLAPCPSGCSQCTHERVVPPAIPMLPGLHGSSPGLFPTPLGARPNVCSWMVGDSYCGKRFNSSEELLSHLRTHTTLPGDLPPPLLSPPTLPFSAATTPPLPPPPTTTVSSAAAAAAAASLRRSYPSPSISPISSSRYHPYSKSSTVTSTATTTTMTSTPPSIPGFPGSPFGALPPHPSALPMFYNPYAALYGQRLGPPVHP